MLLFSCHFLALMRQNNHPWSYDTQRRAWFSPAKDFGLIIVHGVHASLNSLSVKQSLYNGKRASIVSHTQCVHHMGGSQSSSVIEFTVRKEFTV